MDEQGVKVVSDDSDGEIGRLFNALIVALVENGMPLGAGVFVLQAPFSVEDSGAEWVVSGSVIHVAKEGLVQ